MLDRKQAILPAGSSLHSRCLVKRHARGNIAAPRERGITLVVSLIFLLLLTMLGVTAMSTSTLQEKMAGNLRDQDMALQAAESALRAGETPILALTLDTKTNCDNASIWCPHTLTYGDFYNAAWWPANAQEYGGGGKQLTFTGHDPYYAVEYLQSVRQDLSPNSPRLYFYRINSRGTGTTELSQTILQSTFRRVYN
jgi:type IV pilus assembly protein PilX